MERLKELAAGDAEWVRMAAVVETCCVFFSVLYGSGKVCARLFGATPLREEIKAQARWHMPVLYLCLGSVVLAGRGFMLQRQAGSQAANAAMIGLGLVLLAGAAALFLRRPARPSSRPGLE
jgi:hypothetical protein